MPTPNKCPSKIIFLAIAVFSANVGCQTEDTGHCCRTLIADASSALPEPELGSDGGLPRNLVGQHPAYDCESLTCVSWEGSNPFCTRKCTSQRPCPLGFECRPVLESSAGAGASIQPEDTFCVRRSCETDIDCPDEFTCKPAFQAQGSSTEPLKHCIRPENVCN